MKNCDECGELIGDSASKSPFSGRLLCVDCLVLFGEDEDEDGPLDLEDRLDAALLPFCACGRTWGNCDRSRRGCRNRPPHPLPREER